MLLARPPADIAGGVGGTISASLGCANACDGAWPNDVGDLTDGAGPDVATTGSEDKQ